jgi:hypothetical protein
VGSKLDDDATKLEKLRGDIAAADPPPAESASSSPASSSPAADFGKEAALLVTFLCETVSADGMYPSLRTIYTAETQSKIAAALAAVMAKYNLDFAQWLARWHPEISLALVTVPLIVPTIEAVRRDLAASKAEKVPAAEEKTR